MLELEEARKRLLAALPPLSAETVPLEQVQGRITAATITAPISLPPFDNSAMDGYAVRSEDLTRARVDHPVCLRVAGRVTAGEICREALPPAHCWRIFTGSVLPAGADAVVMQEETQLGSGQGGEVWFRERVKPWENVRFAGEDVKAGMKLIGPGTRMTAGRIGLLAASGISRVTVHRQPVIGLLATGSELSEPDVPLREGCIYESNRSGLSTLLLQCGAIPRRYPLVQDTMEETRAALALALNECDAVLTTGGVSVGELDWVKEAFVALGGSVDFWRVAIKPGKPFAFGTWGDKVLFGLPGNPVSALVSFLLLTRPALLHWQGAAEVELPVSIGILEEPLVNRGERRHFMRVTVDHAGKVRLSGVQASHILSSLAEANGLVDVPARTTREAGMQVPVLRWE